MLNIVTCVCGQKNRIPPTWTPGRILRCGRCKAEGLEADLDLELDDEDVDEEDDDE